MTDDSRYVDYGEDDANASYLWWANARRAIAGRRGRAVLTEMRSALMALPEHRLARGTMGRLVERDDGAEHGEACAAGALLWYRRVQQGMDPLEAFGELEHIGGDELHDTAYAVQAETKMAFTLAWTLAYLNDEHLGRGITPEQRWTRYVAWIDEQLAAPVGKAVGLAAGLGYYAGPFQP